MTELNDRQKTYLETHGNGKTLKDCPPEVRLQVANLGDGLMRRPGRTPDLQIVAPPKTKYEWDDAAGELVPVKRKQAPLPPEDRPDLAKLDTVAPERRSEYADAVSTVKAARAEAHLPVSSRRISPDRLKAAEDIVSYYTKPE